MKKYIIGPNMKKDGLFAGNKFPRDIIDICRKKGYIPVYIHEGYIKKRAWEFIEDYYHLLKISPRSQVIYIDRVHPNLARKIVFFILKNKKADIIPLLEDIDPLRDSTISKRQKEKAIKKLNNSKYIISQNKKMSNYLKENNVFVPTLELNVLDFLSSKSVNPIVKNKKSNIICYGGNLSLSQSGFLHNIKVRADDNIRYYVYGKGEGKNNLPNFVDYKGSFSAENCVGNLKGDWGLVWNGSSLKVNVKDSKSKYYDYVSPHKFSMYAVCGMPVIVSTTSAMAQFVIENRCGIVIDNIEELPKIINSISAEKYLQYRSNILKIACKASKGAYTEEILNEIGKE